MVFRNLLSEETPYLAVNHQRPDENKIYYVIKQYTKIKRDSHKQLLQESPHISGVRRRYDEKSGV